MSRRKSIVVKDDVFGNKSPSVEPIRLELLVLKTDSFSSYFEQLNYKFAPNFLAGGKKKNGIEYIPMGREGFVRDIYRILEPNWGETNQANFTSIRSYVRWLDENDFTAIDDDFFHSDLIKKYMAYHKERVNLGKQKKSTWNGAKRMLSFILKAKGRDLEAKRLPSIKGIKRDTNSYRGIDLKGEFRPLIKIFLSSFNKFSKHFKEGTSPDIHPFWNEELFNKTAEKEGWSKKVKGAKKANFIRAVKNKYGNNAVVNHFARLAIVITFCFTGQNTTPILNLRFSDMRFCTKLDGKVYFDMEKARANNLSFDTSMGFKPRVQEFLHQWIAISKQLQSESGTDWVFPYHTDDGTVKSFLEAGRNNPQEAINRLTALLGLAHINSSVLRQTKIDTLMKVTEDIWLVSMSANNTVSVIEASYGSGHESDHRNNLAASHSAMYDIAQGAKNIDDAVNDAKYEFSDVLSDYDYKRLRDTENDKLTPVGSRCKDATKGSAQVIKKNLERIGIEQTDEATCTDFLSCFDCGYHRLVAEVEDIWLMLSFNDTLEEMKEYPSINTLPTDKFHKICNTIQAILKRFKEISSKNFSMALEKKHSEGPHPLYSDAYSLNDLLETFS